MRINDSIQIGLFLAIGIPLLACLCDGISLATCLLLSSPGLIGALLYLLVQWLWPLAGETEAEFPTSAKMPSREKAPTPEEEAAQLKRQVDRLMNNQSKMRIGLSGLQDLGDAMLVLDIACKADLVTDDFDGLKEKAVMMIKKIDDMSLGIDELIHLLEAS